MSPFAKALIVTFILAVTGFFLAPFIGLGAGSLAAGIIIGGVVAGLIAKSGKQRESAPRPRAVAPAKTTATVGASDTNTETLFVGNLAFRANRHGLVKLFSEYGTVNNARIVTDRNTRKPKGYGFIEVAAADADKMIAKLDGADFFGRELKVSRANKHD